VIRRALPPLLGGPIGPRTFEPDGRGSKPRRHPREAASTAARVTPTRSWGSGAGPSISRDGKAPARAFEPLVGVAVAAGSDLGEV